MHFLSALFDPKSPAKFVVQRLGVIAHHVQTAALLRAFRSEGAHNDVAARLHGTKHGANVRFALRKIRQKMEYRTIVPDIERVGRQREVRDIVNDPGGATRTTVNGGFAGREARDNGCCVVRSAQLSNDLPQMRTKSSSAITRLGRTPPCRCVLTIHHEQSHRGGLITSIRSFPEAASMGIFHPVRDVRGQEPSDNPFDSGWAALQIGFVGQPRGTRC